MRLRSELNGWLSGTPKEFRLIAQGRRVSRPPWGWVALLHSLPNPQATRGATACRPRQAVKFEARTFEPFFRAGLILQSNQPTPEKVSELTPECTASTQKPRTSAPVSMHQCSLFAALLQAIPRQDSGFPLPKPSFPRRASPCKGAGREPSERSRGRTISPRSSRSARSKTRESDDLSNHVIAALNGAPAPPRVTLHFLRALRELRGQLILGLMCLQWWIAPIESSGSHGVAETRRGLRGRSE